MTLAFFCTSLLDNGSKSQTFDRIKKLIFTEIILNKNKMSLD